MSRLRRHSTGFEAGFDAGQLRQRHGDAAAREDLQVAELSDALALLGRGPNHHVDELFAAADLRHRGAFQRRLHQALDVGAGQAQQPCLVLVDVDLHRADLLVPVELRVTHQRTLAHCVAHAVGDLAHLGLVGPDDAELHWKTHRRAELQALDPRLHVRQGLVLVEERHQPAAHAFALLDAGGLDDELGEARIRQLRLDGQVEARRAGAGVGGEELDVRILRQALFQQLHLPLRRGEGCAFAQPQVHQQFRP
jgi:hypothetical protein